MKRVMCVYLPGWALQGRAHGNPALRDKPVAIADPRAARGPQVVLCSRRAARSGVRPGMPVAEALAVERRLLVLDADPEEDLHALERLARRAGRVDPRGGLGGRASPPGLPLRAPPPAPPPPPPPRREGRWHGPRRTLG